MLLKRESVMEVIEGPLDSSFKKSCQGLHQDDLVTIKTEPGPLLKIIKSEAASIRVKEEVCFAATDSIEHEVDFNSEHDPLDRFPAVNVDPNESSGRYIGCETIKCEPTDTIVLNDIIIEEDYEDEDQDPLALPEDGVGMDQSTQREDQIPRSSDSKGVPYLRILPLDFLQSPETNKQLKSSDSEFCPFCHSGFPDTASLRTHLSTPGFKPTKYPCPDCTKSFVWQENLEDHQNNTHNDPLLAVKKQFFCPACPRRFYTRKHLKMHLDMHRREKTPCCSCPELFSNPCELATHVRMSHLDIVGAQKDNQVVFVDLRTIHANPNPGNSPSGPVRSPVEDDSSIPISVYFGFPSFNETQTETKNFLREAEPLDPSFLQSLPRCEICRLQFHDHSELVKHSAVHLNHTQVDQNIKCSPPGSPNGATLLGFECEICAAQFLDRSELFEHLKQHSYNPPPITEETQESYPSTVYNSRSSVCRVCHVQFLNDTELAEHMTNHWPSHFPPAEAALQKNHFGSVDINHNESANQKRPDSHSTEPYVSWAHRASAVCKEPHLDSRKNSGKTSETATQINSGKRDYICKLCHTAFYTSAALARHSEKIHSEVREPMPQIFNCQFCPATFSARCNLMRHLFASHSRKRKSRTDCPVNPAVTLVHEKRLASSMSPLFSHNSSLPTNHRNQVSGSVSFSSSPYSNVSTDPLYQVSRHKFYPSLQSDFSTNPINPLSHYPPSISYPHSTVSTSPSNQVYYTPSPGSLDPCFSSSPQSRQNFYSRPHSDFSTHPMNQLSYYPPYILYPYPTVSTNPSNQVHYTISPGSLNPGVSNIPQRRPVSSPTSGLNSGVPGHQNTNLSCDSSSSSSLNSVFSIVKNSLLTSDVSSSEEYLQLRHDALTSDSSLLTYPYCEPLAISSPDSNQSRHLTIHNNPVSESASPKMGSSFNCPTVQSSWQSPYLTPGMSPKSNGLASLSHYVKNHFLPTSTSNSLLPTLQNDTLISTPKPDCWTVQNNPLSCNISSPTNPDSSSQVGMSYLELVRKKGLHRCEYCLAKYFSASDLMKHLTSKHPDEYLDPTMFKSGTFVVQYNEIHS